MSVTSRRGLYAPERLSVVVLRPEERQTLRKENDGAEGSSHWTGVPGRINARGSFLR